MQLYLRVGFTLPNEASFLLIYVVDSADARYHPHVVPRPDINYGKKNTTSYYFTNEVTKAK